MRSLLKIVTCIFAAMLISAALFACKKSSEATPEEPTRIPISGGPAGVVPSETPTRTGAADNLARSATPTTPARTVTPAATSAPAVSGPAALTLSPASGLAGSTVAVAGTGFGSNTFGGVFLDINGNGSFDAGEPLQYVTTSATGGFSTTLAIPSALATKLGPYNVRAAFALSSAQAAATFTVSNIASPTISLNPTGGAAGTTVTVTGTGFPPNTYGAILFDTNGNGAADPGEPVQPVTTSSTGTFTSNLAVPAAGVTPGAYSVRTAFTFSAAQATAIFTVTAGAPATGAPIAGAPSPAGTTAAPVNSAPAAAVTVPPATAATLTGTINLSASSGHLPTSVTVTGLGFSPNTPGGVFLDVNRNNAFDSGEPLMGVTSSQTGTITVTLELSAISGVVPGSYQIFAALPLGQVRAAAPYTVLP